MATPCIYSSLRSSAPAILFVAQRSRRSTDDGLSSEGDVPKGCPLMNQLGVEERLSQLR